MRKIASVLSSTFLYIAASAASRLAALHLDHICPMCFLVAPGQPGAALRERVIEPLIQDTRYGPSVSASVHFILLP